MPSQSDNQAHYCHSASGQFYIPNGSSARFPPDTQTFWPPMNSGASGQSSPIAFPLPPMGPPMPYITTVDPRNLPCSTPNLHPGTTTTAGSSYQYGVNAPTILVDTCYYSSSQNAYPGNRARETPVAASSTLRPARSGPPLLALAPSRTSRAGSSLAVHSDHCGYFIDTHLSSGQFRQHHTISPDSYLQNQAPGAASPSLPSPSASTSSTLRAKRQRSYQTHRKNVLPSGSREAHVSSSSWRTPEPLGLQPLPPPASNYKLNALQFEQRRQLITSYSWFNEDGALESPIAADDEFLKREYIRPSDKSRFCAFYGFDPLTRKYFCRIDHDVQIQDEVVACQYEVEKAKDAMAHVCHILNYRRLPCEGKGCHAPCEKTFLTTERRNDHYSKENSADEERITCGCGTTVRKRNLKRHYETCKLRVPTSTQPGRR